MVMTTLMAMIVMMMVMVVMMEMEVQFPRAHGRSEWIVQRPAHVWRTYRTACG